MRFPTIFCSKLKTQQATSIAISSGGKRTIMITSSSAVTQPASMLANTSSAANILDNQQA